MGSQVHFRPDKYKCVSQTLNELEGTQKFEFKLFMLLVFDFLGISRNSCTNMYTKDLIWYLRTIYNLQIGDKRYAD